MQSFFPRLAWLAVLASCLLLAPASAQRREAAKVGVAPPQPVQLTVKVRREGKTEIPLRVHGVAGEPLKFLIRTAAVHGKVAEPRVTGRESAVAVYEPPADLAITTDRFFYAAHGTRGVSAAVEVAITILDRPPELTIPDSLEFPSLRAGTTSSKLLEITNSGGGLAVGEVIAEAPWRIEGKTGYRLPAGDIAVFKLFFAPTAAGTFEKVARYTSEPSRSTTLRGTAESLIAVSPAPLILQPGAGDPVRTGTFEITNQADEPRTLQLKSDPRLEIPEKVDLSPRGKAEVAVRSAAGDTRPLETEIVITAADLEYRLAVQAPAPGAVVRAAPRQVAFGRAPAGQLRTAEFELENVGGAPGEVTWQIGAPFRTAQASTLLLPGEKRRFAIEIQSAKPGRFRAWLQWTHAGRTFDLPVEAEIVDTAARGPTSDARILPVVADLTPSESEIPDSVSAATRLPLEPSVPPEWLPDNPPPAGVKVLRTTPTSGTFHWPTSLSPATSYQVEARIFGFDADRRLQVTWHKFEGLKIASESGNYVTTVSGLEPAQPWVIRVLPILPTGQPGARLFAVGFTTPPRTTALPTITPFRGLIFLLVVLVGWQIYSRWRRPRG